jgi:hypothetical protein
LEDLFNLLVQLCFLVKFWDDFDFYMRSFTITSMMAGLLCSVAGPLKDIRGVYRTQLQARAAGMESRLRLDDRAQAVDPETPKATHSTEGGLQLEGADEDRALLNVALEQPALAAVAGAAPQADKPSAEATAEALLSPGRHASPAPRPIRLYAGSLTEFIHDTEAEHSKLAHGLLIACAIAYWVSMALIPVFFWEGIKGGSGSSVPGKAVMYFMMINISSVMVELWIANHLERGFHMITYACDLITKALHGEYKELMTLAAAGLSIVGRYDTFCDVVFCIILAKTEPITQLHFSHTLGIRVNLPLQLYHISLISLVFGVFVFQGLPGIIFIICKRYLPAAMKLNEFNFLLAMVEYEEQIEASQDDTQP